MRLFFFFFAAALACAQDRAAIESFTASHQPQIMAEFVELLSIPNVATDRANIRRNAEFIRAMLERHGVKTGTARNRRQSAGLWRKEPARRHEDDPFLYSLRRPAGRPGEMETGEPFHPDHARWAHGGRRGAHPWLRFARNLPRQLANLRAFRLGRQSAHRCILRRARCVGDGLRSNIHVVIDGEEEQSSPSLAAAIVRYRDKLRPRCSRA